MPEAKKRGRKPISRKMEEDNMDSQTKGAEEDSNPLVTGESEFSEPVQESSSTDTTEKNQGVSPNERSNDPSCTLYVCRLSLRTREEDLRRLFEDYGEVTDCHLVTNPLSGESRCFGFVTMSNEEEAARAKDALDGKDYQDANLKVETARRAKPYDPTPGEYKGPQYRSIKYNHSRAGYPNRSHRGHSYRPSRSRYDYPPSHSRSEQYNRHGDDFYNSRYYDNRYNSRTDDYHSSRYHSPPRYSRADPYESRYSRR